MSKKNKIRPEVGMLIGIPLSNKSYGLAVITKVVELEKNVYHTIWAFYDKVVLSKEGLDISDVSQFSKPFMVCGMDYEELENGKWPVFGNIKVELENIDINNNDLVDSLMKESIPGALLLEMFLGLQPWNLFKDGDYLDKRLLPGYSRPSIVRLK